MKLAFFVLIGSLTANAILFSVVNLRPSSTSAAEDDPAAAKAGDSRGFFSFGRTAKGGDSTGAKAGKPGVWAALHSRDLSTLLARLQAAGYPPEVVRAVITALVNERFGTQSREILGNPDDTPFWAASTGFGLDATKRAALRQLGRERSSLLKELLGSSAAELSDERQIYQRRRFGDLPPEKIEELQAIVSDYSEMRMEITSAASNILLREDREKIAFLEQEQRKDLAALLSPQELEEYDLRSSSTANQLRTRLAAFNPSEDEFRAIFRIQKAFDDQYPAQMGMLPPEQMRERQTRQRELDAQFQAVLAPDRFAEFKAATEAGTSSISRLVARLQLPPQTVTQLASTQREITQRSTALRRDTSLTPEQKTQQLSALAQEATQRITETLGTRGAEAYKSYGGAWLRTLQDQASGSSGADRAAAPRN